MAKRLTKRGAKSVTTDLDKIATLFQEDFKALGIPKKIAHDFALRCDMLSDEIEKVALTGEPEAKTDYPFNQAETFDAEDIGEEKAGPLEDEPDEPFMTGEFTQQEHRELREKQEGGELGPDVVTTEPQKPTPGVQASFMNLAQALKQTRLTPRKARQIAHALHLAQTVVLAQDEDEEADADEDKEAKKKATHGYNLFA